MNPLKRLGIALFKTLADQGDLIATQVLLPPVSGAIQTRLCRAVTGSPIPPQGRARLATKRGLVTVTVDGGAVDGAVPGAWAKYAIPKGLPEEEGERRMAIENQPHRVDDFDGVIAEGYGKGVKKLVYSGTVAVKIDGETGLRKINIHHHQANRAGTHYDLVCEGVPMGTEHWELYIPNGPFKGRYAFVDASGAMSSGEYNEGRLVTRMRDRGIRLDKPDYRLKDRAWLESEVRRDPGRYSVERKYDGALVNVASTRTARMYLRSHREGGETYYDRFPAWSISKTLPHYSVAAWLSRAGGERRVPRRTGPSGRGGQGRWPFQFHARQGPTISARTWRRRALRLGCGRIQGQRRLRAALPRAPGHLPKLVDELRPYCKNMHLAEAAPDGMDAVEFYEKVIGDRRGLPYSEGIVVKDLNDPSGGVFLKIKPREEFDWRIAPGGIVEGAGKYAASPSARSWSSTPRQARAASWAAWPCPTPSGNGSGTIAPSWKARPWPSSRPWRSPTPRGPAGVFTGLHQAKGGEAALQAIGQQELF